MSSSNSVSFSTSLPITIRPALAVCLLQRRTVPSHEPLSLTLTRLRPVPGWKSSGSLQSQIDIPHLDI
eukprot:252878-Prymnesium_polylepis.1